MYSKGSTINYLGGVVKIAKKLIWKVSKKKKLKQMVPQEKIETGGSPIKKIEPGGSPRKKIDSAKISTTPPPDD